ncbi:flagellin N-terminal helical domain-containing protein [Selenomonas ruminis]|uniref:Flagellin n=1 Tax=Selenomonas ruminis TaxID=2593411 RepID=A0A5D6VVM5_9FIRM|nr:flagellin [Selenomonas sp. mPRGC5]TYZ19716.1 hypothetical protein FZ040_12935 [Selenomonas sp. mPRGC5]
MSMVIMNSGAAMHALRESKKNSNKLSKDLKKAANGMKISGAGDGAAEYSISEKMRVMIRSLGQDIENAKKGIDLVKIAETGMQDIIDELRDMKAMAIDSANDHNSEVDRAVLQKEFASRMAGIDNIAATTNYNGKILMDGRYWYKEYDEMLSGSNSGMNQSNKTRNSNLLINTKNLNTVWGMPQLVRSKLFLENTSKEQAKLNPKTPPTENAIENMFPTSPTGKAFLLDYGYLDGYMPNEYDKTKKFPREYKKLEMPNVIQGNFLPPIYQKVENGSIKEYTANNMPQDGQTVYVKNKDNTYTPCVFYGKTYDDASIITMDYSDVSYGEKRYQAELDFSNANINGKALKFPSDLNNQSITIMCKECEQYIGIKLETGRPAGTGIMYKTDEGINGKKIKNSYVYAIGLGTDDCAEADVLENIFKGIKAANDAAGMEYQLNDTLLISKIHSVMLYHDIEKGTYSFLKKDQPMVIYNGGIGALSGGGEEEAQAPNPDPPEPDPPEPDPPEPDPPEPDPPEPNPQYERRSKRFEGNPLIIHYGPKQNQHLRVYINDMHTKAMGLQDVVIDPIEEARKAMGKLDEALDYALNELTRMGAYQTKLQYTIDNNTTAEENITSAESVIRDADMAKSMMNYVKDNILTQTSKAILAQANHNRGLVLNLLQ